MITILIYFNMSCELEQLMQLLLLFPIQDWVDSTSFSYPSPLHPLWNHDLQIYWDSFILTTREDLLTLTYDGKIIILIAFHEELPICSMWDRFFAMRPSCFALSTADSYFFEPIQNNEMPRFFTYKITYSSGLWHCEIGQSCKIVLIWINIFYLINVEHSFNVPNKWTWWNGCSMVQ